MPVHACVYGCTEMQPKVEQETVAPYQVRGALVCLHKILLDSDHLSL